MRLIALYLLRDMLTWKFWAFVFAVTFLAWWFDVESKARAFGILE